MNYKEVNTYPHPTRCEEVDFRSFDVEQNNTLGSDTASFTRNYWEYFFNLITPMILVLLIYAHIIPCILTFLLFLGAALLHTRQMISRQEKLKMETPDQL